MALDDDEFLSLVRRRLEAKTVAILTCLRSDGVAVARLVAEDVSRADRLTDYIKVELVTEALKDATSVADVLIAFSKAEGIGRLSRDTARRRAAHELYLDVLNIVEESTLQEMDASESSSRSEIPELVLGYARHERRLNRMEAQMEALAHASSTSVLLTKFRASLEAALEAAGAVARDAPRGKISSGSISHTSMIRISRKEESETSAKRTASDKRRERDEVRLGLRIGGILGEMVKLGGSYAKAAERAVEAMHASADELKSLRYDIAVANTTIRIKGVNVEWEGRPKMNRPAKPQ